MRPGEQGVFCACPRIFHQVTTSPHLSAPETIPADNYRQERLTATDSMRRQQMYRLNRLTSMLQVVECWVRHSSQISTISTLFYLVWTRPQTLQFLSLLPHSPHQTGLLWTKSSLDEPTSTLNCSLCSRMSQRERTSSKEVVSAHTHTHRTSSPSPLRTYTKYIFARCGAF